VPQEERSIFSEVRVSVILSEKVYVYMCPIPNGFRDIIISTVPKLLTRKIYYLLFLISVFIFQMEKLVQFT
jgi:hypothetical protein